MRIPFEIFLLSLGLSASLLWSALRLRLGSAERLGFALVALSLLTIGISSRFPPSVGATGSSPFVFVGVWMMLGGIATAAVGGLTTVWRHRRHDWV
jgi:hypothetical protein